MHSSFLGGSVSCNFLHCALTQFAVIAIFAVHKNYDLIENNDRDAKFSPWKKKSDAVLESQK
jgi:hypothetical protein